MHVCVNSNKFDTAQILAQKEREADNMLEAGIKGRQEVMVTDENSAAAVGSGLLPVFATPAMVALMEKTAWMSVAPYLNDGEGTVGTKLEIAHNAATPVGMQVWCESELVEVDGRRLVFKVEDRKSVV